MKIEDIDKNMKVATVTDHSDIDWYDASDAPFDLHGVTYGTYADGTPGYIRLPFKVAEATNSGIVSLYRHTAGGKVLFRTDSPFIAIHAEMPDVGHMAHFAPSGSSAFDLFALREDGWWFHSAFLAPYDMQGGYESRMYTHLGEHDFMINFPTYSAVSRLLIGVQKGAKIAPPAWHYRNDKPVVFYGSSITQGGCTSRPGNAYEEIISRAMDLDVRNLGFSGSCHAEMPMIDYIAEQPMAALVYDYDHNDASVPLLAERHERGYLAIRKKNPDLPIVIVTRPDSQPFHPEGDATAGYPFNRRVCRDLIYGTYERARARGENVYFVDGYDFFPASLRRAETVDGCHPNDIGFYFMAKAIGAALSEALGIPCDLN